MALQDTKYPMAKLRLVCVFEAALLLIAYAAGWVANIDPLETVTKDWFPVIVGLVAVLPLLVLLSWGLNHPRDTIGKITVQAREFVIQFLDGVGIFGFMLIALLAGVGEEALFRGFLQTLVAQYSSQWIGLIVASVLFGIAHAVSRAYAVTAAIIGAYLGLLFLYTGSIVAPIVCHAVYDFLALVWLVRSNPGKLQ